MAARVHSLEKTSLDHQDLIFGIEKATSDRADELDIELKDYKHSNKEDLRSLRKYNACFGFYFLNFVLNVKCQIEMLYFISLKIKFNPNPAC